MRHNSAKFDAWDQSQYFINNLLTDLAYFEEDKTNGIRSTFDIFKALGFAYGYASELPKPVYLAHIGPINVRLIKV